MQPIERQLLDNLFDSLDRLYDAESSVLDVYALLMATSHALATSSVHEDLERPLATLLAIIRSGDSEDQCRTAALTATDDLRRRLAQDP